MPKKDEKAVQKEEPKKQNSFADKIKNMGGSNTTPSSTAKPIQNPKDFTKKEPPKESQANAFFPQRRKITVAATKGNLQFANRLNDMFKNSKVPPGAKRPSVTTGIPQNIGKCGAMIGGGGKTMDIIKEEPDKMKTGYDPSLSLSKTLDSVVVAKKDKKKKKKPSTFVG